MLKWMYMMYYHIVVQARIDNILQCLPVAVCRDTAQGQYKIFLNK